MFQAAGFIYHDHASAAHVLVGTGRRRRLAVLEVQFLAKNFCLNSIQNTNLLKMSFGIWSKHLGVYFEFTLQFGRKPSKVSLPASKCKIVAMD